MNIALLIIGLVAAVLIGWLLGNRGRNTEHLQYLEKQKELENRALRSESELESLQRHSQAILLQKEQELAAIKQETIADRSKILELSNDLVKSVEAAKFLEQKLEDQKNELIQLRVSFNQEFENIANRLFKIHSKEFSDNSTKNIGDILNPLKERIQLFEAKVNEAYDKEMRDKVSLKEQVINLLAMNKQLGEDANNLTKALKGDNKTMGNWGEVLLERILEQSGLEKGTVYKTQVSTSTEEGKRYQPDVIIYLPDNKHIVIDSKVSLVAYERYANATNEEDRQKYIKEHLASVYGHVKALSSKNYQHSEDFNAPDFVLLFIAIEPSFSVAVREDNSLFDFAWKNKIVIVSPSTLLATLMTIQSIWKQENQTKNALEIAKQGANLYDKFAGFVEDLRKIGNNLGSTQKAYDDAMGKLFTGKGSLVSRVESLKKLGVRPTKALPGKFIDNGELDLPLIDTEND